MIIPLIDHIKDTYLAPQAWVGMLSGLVKPVTMTMEGPEQRMVKKSFPVGCNVTHEDCIKKGRYRDLVPDSKYKSVVYFEEQSTQVTAQEGNLLTFRTQVTLVAWLNLMKLGIADCSVSALLIAQIIKNLPRQPFNYQLYTRVGIKVTQVLPKDNRVFAKYSYDASEVPYFMYPYDYFAINLQIDFTIDMRCLDDYIPSPEVECLTDEIPAP